MPKIPLYQHTPQASQPNQVRANPNMYAGVGAAGERLGSALAGVGNTMADFAVKKMEAVNYSTLQDADRKMKEGWLLYQDELKTNPDETTWEDGWQKQAVKIEKELGSKRVPEAIKPKMKSMADDWKMQTSLAVRSAATGAAIKRSTGQVTLAYEQSLKEGDVDMAIQKIADGAKLGLFSEAEAAKLTREAPGKVDKYDIARLMAHDPISAHRALTDKTDGGRFRNFTNLDDNERATAINSAGVAASKVRTANYQDLIQRNLKGQPAKKDEIMGMVDDGRLTATQAQNYLNGQAIGKYAPLGTFPRVLEEVTHYTLAADPKGYEYERLVGMIAVSNLMPVLANKAVEALNQRRDPKSAVNTPAGSFGQSELRTAFDQGIYGDFKSPRAGGGDVIDPKKYNAATVVLAEQLERFDAFMLENPKADRVEVVKFVQGLNQKYLDGKLSKSLRSWRTWSENIARLDIILEEFRKNRVETNLNKK